MRKPITIAMAISFAVHCGLFLVLALVWDRLAEPSATGTLLVLNLETPVTDQGPDTDEERDSRSEPDDALSAAEVSGTPAADQPRARSIAAAESEPPAAAAPPSGERPSDALPAEPLPAAAEEVDKVDIVPSAGIRLVASASPSDFRVPPGYSEFGRRSEEFLAIPDDQEQMLRRRFSEWTEEDLTEWDTESTLRWEHDGQEYEAVFTPLPAADDMGLDEVHVVITTERDGERLRTEMRMKRLAFSNFAQFVHWWDPAVQVHNDALDGRFHSNSRITLAFSGSVRPLFLGKVTTSSSGFRVGDRVGRLRREDIFLGGLETGVREIRLPAGTVPFPDSAAADEPPSVHHFERDARIVFAADGSYEWQWTEEGEGVPERVELPAGPAYLVAGEDARLYVRGVVRGQVLVYSPARIVIEGDLVYSDDRRRRAASGDYLGLVSDGSVEVAPRRVTGPGDLRINAAIYAKRRFAVRGYRSRGNDLLYLYGSLTAGSITATEPRYSTRIEFDPRLEKLRPPGFPVSDRFEVDQWDGRWVVDDRT